MSIISQLDEVCKSKAGAKTWSKGGPQGPKLETLVLYQVSIVWKVEWSSWWRRLKQFKSHGCPWIFTLNFVCLVSIKKQQIKSIGGWMGRQCCCAFVCSYLECVSLCMAMSCVKWASETICLFGVYLAAIISHYPSIFPINNFIFPNVISTLILLLLVLLLLLVVVVVVIIIISLLSYKITIFISVKAFKWTI